MKKLIIVICLYPYFLSGQNYFTHQLKVFDVPLNYKKDTFNSQVRYIDVKFNKQVDFSEAIFDMSAEFNHCKFNKADFAKAQFKNTAKFLQTDFLKDVKFSDAKFFEIIFNQAEFDSLADFTNANFYSNADFGFAKFKNRANFENDTFHSTVNFYKAKFDSVANFSGATFMSNADFRFAKLPSYLNFSRVIKIEEEINLTYSEVNKNETININLINANIDKIKFRYSRFKLFFPEGTNQEIKANVYEKLLIKQQEEGFLNSVKKIDKEYKEFKYKKNNNYIFGSFLNWLDKWWWDYGYKKERIIINTIILFFLFTLINSILLKHLVNRVYEIPKIKEYRLQISGSNKLRNYIKAFPIAIFYTGLIFFGLKFSIEKLYYTENLKGWKLLNLLYFFLIYLIGLICVGYLANYVITS